MRQLGMACRYAAMGAIALLTLLPIFWMITSSFRTHEEIFRFTTLSWHLFFPEHWTLKNYADIFGDASKPFGRYMGNSLVVAVIVTGCGLVLNSMAAFAFAKLRFPVKRIAFGLFLSSMVIPYEVIMIPQYLIIRDFAWINSYKALIFPQIIWVFGIFMLIQFFAEVPRDVLDAARIDSATWLQVYVRIMLPLAVPALITLGLITFINQWDAFLWPLIVINDDKKQMIQVAVASFQSLRGISWGKILAATTISSLPNLLIFLFLQRYYVKGIMMSGVKG